ncbi:MAG: 23S rRNA (guanine1835-N2)-methyltransferase [Oceanicoccus sp.]|jgi:23S rRNA (guanine1835-N2)-methyltransferase
MITSYGRFRLERLPLRQNEKLQAWDAADELIINHIFCDCESTESNTQATIGSVLLVNDSFGSLSVALNHYEPDNWSDSVTSHESAKYNIKLNKLNPVNCIKSINSLNKRYDLVLMKLPKTSSLLEHQLIEIRKNLSEKATVIASGMIKHNNKSQLALFEKYIGKTHTSLAKKKARLVFSAPEKPILSQNYSSPFPSQYKEESIAFSLHNHANVFSHNKLDIGTRFMLSQFPKLPEAKTILDLGCGNGVLGISAAIFQKEKHGIESNAHFVDESYMAIDSAKKNVLSTLGATGKNFSNFQFHENISLEKLEINNVDLILCNPPFHQNHTIGDHIAKLMIANSKKMLVDNGVLWLVGNRHLNYKDTMKRTFGNCQVIASNKQFDVLSSEVFV